MSVTGFTHDATRENSPQLPSSELCTGMRHTRTSWNVLVCCCPYKSSTVVVGSENGRESVAKNLPSADTSIACVPNGCGLSHTTMGTPV
jgi:hypothetical protein